MAKVGWLLFLGLIVALVAAACGGGAEPTATPTTAVVVKTPTPTSTVPPGVTPTRVAATPTPTQVVVGVTPTPGPTVKRGGIVSYYGNGTAASYDMFLNGFSAELSYGPGVVYSGLLKKQGGPELSTGAFRIVCDLCDSWEQTDPVTYVFHLHHGAIFSKSVGNPLSDFPGVNGRELTADDVVWSVLHQQCATCANRNLVQFVVKAEAVDKYTVRLVLANPDADFIEGLATSKAPVKAHEIADAKGDFTQGPTVGSGPWILVKSDRAVGHEYVRNPDYYKLGVDGKPLPYLDGLKQLVIRDNATAFAAFRTGQLQWFGLNKPQYDVIKKEHPDWTYKFLKNPGGLSYALIIKESIPPFDNVDFRRAVYHAWNPYEIIEDVLYGFGFIHGGADMPLEWAEELEPVAKQYYGDVTKAKQFLAKSGVATPISMPLWVANYGETNITIAQVIQQQMKVIGVNFSIDLHESSEYRATWVRGLWNVPVAFSPVTCNSINECLFQEYHTTGTRAISQSRGNPELNAMIEAQAKEIDPVKRKAQVFDIVKYLLERGMTDGAIGTISITGERPELRGRYPSKDAFDNRYLMDLWLETR